MSSSDKQCPACEGSGLKNRSEHCQFCGGSGFAVKPGWGKHFPEPECATPGDSFSGDSFSGDSFSGDSFPGDMMPGGSLGGRCPHCQANLKIDEPHSRSCPYGRKTDVHELEDWQY